MVVPIEPELGWDDIKAFAKAVADLLARTFPERFTTALNKQKRGGKILLDYLLNVAGATVVAAYSPRAKTECAGIRSDRLGRAQQRRSSLQSL